MKFIYNLLLLSILFIFSIQAQLLEPKLVNIGYLNITHEEFLERIEMTPAFNKQRKNFSENVKLKFLYSLIAEKLWALEALEQALDTTTAIKVADSQIEKMYIRDELFNKEIKNKIFVSEEDFIKGLVKYSKIYFVKFLFSPNKNKIDSLWQLLQDGYNFDKLVNSQKDSIKVTFGDLIESIETDLFTLDVGEHTNILSANDGWYIFKVYNITDKAPTPENKKDEIHKKVKKIVEQRKGEKIQNEFYKSFFSDKKVEVNKTMFKLLSKNLENIFISKIQNRNTQQTNLLSIDATDILNLKNLIDKEDLSKEFVVFSDTSYSLNEFIQLFFFNGFQIEPSKVVNLRNIFNTKIRIFIERELLAKEAYKRNLHKTNRVKKNVDMWKNYFLSQAYLDKIIENVKIDEDEIKTAYKSYYSSDQEEDKNIKKTYRELKNELKRNLAFKKIYKKLINKTVELANENEIKINKELLNKIDITNINTFAIRIMGFGGKITAVPLSKEFTEWVNKWKDKPIL